MERDIQNFAPGVYAQTVPGMLGDQHRVLLRSLERFLSRRPSPTLLVLGCGGEVLPYSLKYRDGALTSSNVARVQAMIRKGRIILLDLTDSSESGLRRSEEVLTRCGFFNRKRFHARRAAGKTFVPAGQVHSTDFPFASIIFLQQNLRDPLLVGDESLDAIDANLSLHHVTQTRETMLRTYRELYRTLKPGGLLHLGEGNVNMNYSEHKLARIGADLARIFRREVAVQDDRDPNHSLHYLLPPDIKDPVLRLSPPTKRADIYVSADAIVHLRPASVAAEASTRTSVRILGDEFRSRGYRQCLVMADHLALPLIDPLLDADRKGLIDPVVAYYETALNRCRRAYAGKRDDLLRATECAIAIERGYAASGIVEYYMGEALILEALATTGFKDLRVIRQSEPFYNILAFKPLAQGKRKRMRSISGV